MTDPKTVEGWVLTWERMAWSRGVVDGSPDDVPVAVARISTDGWDVAYWVSRGGIGCSEATACSEVECPRAVVEAMFKMMDDHKEMTT